MDESSSRFRITKTFDDEKGCVINSIPKFTVYKNEWANRICTIEPGGVFKGEALVRMCNS